MKNGVLTFLFLLGVSCQVLAQAPAKGVEGSWQGALDAGGTQLRLALKVTKSTAGALSAEVVSLDQGAATIPVDLITVKVDSVWLDMKSIGATFVGVLNKERTELAGTYAQGGQELPLTFKRANDSSLTHRSSKDLERGGTRRQHGVARRSTR
jgi:hypothetical protein